VKRGDVILIVAPGDLGKPRPGVIVQADELGGAATILVCPLTSEITARLPIRPLIEPRPGNGLHLRSQIMTDKVIPLRRDRVRRVLGTLDTETQEALDNALLLVLGLTR
jgi:mRNA interferase MazF